MSIRRWFIDIQRQVRSIYAPITEWVAPVKGPQGVHPWSMNDIYQIWPTFIDQQWYTRAIQATNSALQFADTEDGR